MNLICENGFCNCTSTSYYKSASYACGNLSAYLFLMLDKFYFHFLNQVAKKTHLESCTNNTECCCGQYCYHYYSNNENTTRCQCSGDRWWNDAIPYCQKRSTYGEYCASTSECYYYSQNLICSNNLCTCSAPNVTFWNGTYCGKAKFNIKQKNRKQKIIEWFNFIDDVQSYYGDCKIDAGCNPYLGLVCNVTEKNRYNCFCKPYNYWSGSKGCQPQKSYKDSCSQSTTYTTPECLSESGLYCYDYSSCECLADYYWSASSNKCCNCFFSNNL